MQRPIRFLLDENVLGLAALFSDRGHEVLLATEVAAAGTPDQVLAILAAKESLVIVTHDKDFRNMRKMLPEHERRNLSQGTGRLQLDNSPLRDQQRITEEMENIEYHYYQAIRFERPFFMIIQNSGFRLITK